MADNKQSVESILHGQHHKAIGRSSGHRTAIHDAYKSGLEKGVVAAARADGREGVTFDKLNVDDIKKYSQSAAEYATQHLDNYVMKFFLDNPGLNKNLDTALTDQVKSSLYKVLFGEEALVTGEDGKARKVEMNKEYMTDLFQRTFLKAEGTHHDIHALDTEVKAGRVDSNISQKSRYDFGDGIGEDRLEDLLAYTDMSDKLDFSRSLNKKQDMSLLFLAANEKLQLKDNYDSFQTMQGLAASGGKHLLNQSVLDMYNGVDKKKK